jgi:hypothetical protein
VCSKTTAASSDIKKEWSNFGLRVFFIVGLLPFFSKVPSFFTIPTEAVSGVRNYTPAL